jgi:hypothetical protein
LNGYKKLKVTLHFLNERVVFGKIHDLVVVALLKQVIEIEPMWEMFREDLAYLSDFAIVFRYPGESADKETSRDAQRRRRVFCNEARRALGLTG